MDCARHRCSDRSEPFYYGQIIQPLIRHPAHRATILAWRNGSTVEQRRRKLLIVLFLCFQQPSAGIRLNGRETWHEILDISASLKIEPCRRVYLPDRHPSRGRSRVHSYWKSRVIRAAVLQLTTTLISRFLLELFKPWLIAPHDRFGHGAWSARHFSKQYCSAMCWWRDQRLYICP